MFDHEHEQKTEKATPQRRQKAREKGQVVRSRELISMASLAGVILFFYFAGHSFFANLSALTANLLSLRYGYDPVTVMRATASESMWIMMPLLGFAFTLAILSGSAQGGIIIKPLSIELGRLNPLQGIKRIFSRYGFVAFLKSIFTFILVSVLFFYIIKESLPIFAVTVAMDIKQIQAVAGGLIVKTVLSAFGIFLVLAVADYFSERWKFERSLRMSPEEMKREYRETEGDPIIKSRIKSLQRELAQRRMMQQIPKATVVITNPTHIAVALRYKKDEMEAPKVIAKGAGFVAERIKEIARKYAIPIVEDKPLARALYKLTLNAYIPEALYRAVAKILAYIYTLRGVA